MNYRQWKKKYNASHIKRVPLDMQISSYEKLSKAASEWGETVNGYIKTAINQRMERDGFCTDEKSSWRKEIVS